MQRSIFTAILVSVCLYSGTAVSDTFCNDSDCTINLTFPNGGSIIAPQGANILFGTDANISLGQGGSVVLGDNGYLDGVADTTLQTGGVINAATQIVLGANGEIHFGNGGVINLGSGGNIDYPTDSQVTIDNAASMDVKTDIHGGVVLANVNTLGDVFINYTETTAPNSQYYPPPNTGIIFTNAQDTATVNINIETGWLYFDSITSPYITFNGITLLNGSGGAGTITQNTNDCNNPSTGSGSVATSTGSVTTTIGGAPISSSQFCATGTITGGGGDVSVGPTTTPTLAQNSASGNESGGGSFSLLFLIFLFATSFSRIYQKIHVAKS